MGDGIINFAEKKKQAIEQRRREFERLMFQNYLGVYSVVDDHGALYPIELVDISDAGCMIQQPWSDDTKNHYAKDAELGLRIYFTKSAYIPLRVMIKHNNEYTDSAGKNFIRYGCEFDKSCQSFAALESFITFLYKFAEHSVQDRGNSKIICI